MRLELGTFPVDEVVLGERTHWDSGKLEIDAKGIRRAILSDPRVVEAHLELIRPGDSVRVTSVRDVLEPRVKVRGPGEAYPGVCGRAVAPVGRGRSHRLSGIAVVEVAEVDMYTGNDGWLDGFIDMGLGSPVPYTAFPNLCVVLDVDTALDIEDRNNAAHSAALLVSDQLAATTVDLDPPELETFELAEADPGLPKAVYITCHRSPEHYSDSLNAFWTAIYGFTRLTPPWVLHPNELLDGAISVLTSWELINNPIVREMYSRHGVDYNFVGCIAIRTRWSSQAEKDITSLQAAKVARTMGATGAVISYDAGGNDFMEAIRTVQACEQEGVKAIFVTGEEDPSTGGPPLLEPLPEARAIVSTGMGLRGAGFGPLPAVDRVIGKKDLVENGSTRQGTVPAAGPLPGIRWQDHFGFTRLSAYEF
jgi:glycine reductase